MELSGAEVISAASGETFNEGADCGLLCLSAIELSIHYILPS